MKKLTVLVIFIMICNMVVAQDYFIKFDGIDGEAKSSSHSGWSNIESINQELNKIPVKTGVSRKTATVYGKYVSIIKKLDKSSPKIIEALTTGSVIPFVKIEIVKSGNVIYRYELTNVTTSCAFRNKIRQIE